MRFLVYAAPTPAEDLALEEAIHLAVEEGASPNTWRLWQATEPAVILGTGQEAAKEANLQVAKDERVRVLRRHSGGGAVVIGPGTLNFSAFFRFADLPGSDTIHGAMSAVLAPVIKLLNVWKMDSREAGISDLTVFGKDGTLRKIAGNSQARKKHSVVVHGTLLADPDWSRLSRLLPFPSSSPDYRAGRDHRAFLTSLKENGAPHDLESFREGLSAVLTSGIYISTAPEIHESERAAKCLEEKYGSDAWNLRR